MAIYRETFKSNFAQCTEGDALGQLEKIRRQHPESHGWRELNAFVEQDPVTGLWRAVRVHEKES